ncbi:MAG: hypothetical protein AAFR37_00160 [Cyanobacteria bacterium J06628_3]
MASSQFSIRIPPELDEKVKEYAVVNNTTKSRVMIDALAYYLGCVDDVPLSRKVMELEKRLTSLETGMRNGSCCSNANA